jgi:hypothetical protein
MAVFGWRALDRLIEHAMGSNQYVAQKVDPKRNTERAKAKRVLGSGAISNTTKTKVE